MSKVKFTFLGTGSAFAKKNYQNNLLIENGTENILIDSGQTASRSLFEMKKNAANIRNVFISHLHGDHIHGLEEMGFMHKFVFRPMAKKKYEGLEKKLTDKMVSKDGQMEASQENYAKVLNKDELKEYNILSKDVNHDWKPTIYSTINILNDLWSHCLRGGLNSIQYEMTLLDDFFNIEKLFHNDKKHASFTKCGLRFELVRTDHIYIEKKFDVPCYGLIIEKVEGGKKILFTGDTKFDYENFQWLFKHCDVIFHDCQLFDQPAAIHATYNELKSLPTEIKAKMWLMHYGDTFEQFDPKKDGFKGFIPQQKAFDFDEL